jgi:hypothetical protein
MEPAVPRPRSRAARSEGDGTGRDGTGRDGTGRDGIPQEYQRFLAARPTLDGESQPALRFGDLALTSTRFSGGATAEVARRQRHGTWLCVIDQPSILS